MRLGGVRFGLGLNWSLIASDSGEGGGRIAQRFSSAELATPQSPSFSGRCSLAGAESLWAPEILTFTHIGDFTPLSQMARGANEDRNDG